MNTALMFSSKTALWSTPQSLFNSLDEEFHFTCDVCANEENNKCPRYFSEELNGLTQPWIGMCWMNPPYGREIGKWVRKAWESSRYKYCKGVVCLLPARTDTSWWHDYCMKGEIRFIRGRLKFGSQTNSAPFPSALVIFSQCCTGREFYGVRR